MLGIGALISVVVIAGVVVLFGLAWVDDVRRDTIDMSGPAPTPPRPTWSAMTPPPASAPDVDMPPPPVAPAAPPAAPDAGAGVPDTSAPAAGAADAPASPPVQILTLAEPAPHGAEAPAGEPEAEAPSPPDWPPGDHSPPETA